MKCTIIAPAAGMVVYANDNRSRWGSSEPEIYEGAVVRDRQSILRLPDLQNMQVKTTVHESKVDQIRPGMPAQILIQGKPFTGHVVSMANQPESQSFMSANVKEYATIVAIDGSPTGLRPGMTAEVTILIAEVKNAHHAADHSRRREAGRILQLRQDPDRHRRTQAENRRDQRHVPRDRRRREGRGHGRAQSAGRGAGRP